ncbi:hypothetical protein ACH4JZ_18415 [Streptomyces sp. NPDC017615]|uniref:hypothetical protein n=1 Tax=Streptomyces sp. NPDC017615 TaxID=3365003 RepID=UPI0037BDB94D
MSVTIPGALADHLARTDLTAGPGGADLREALDAGRRGRGRTLVIQPRSTTVLHTISAYAEALIINRTLHTAAEVRAAKLWIERVGRAPAHTEQQLDAAAEAHLDQVETEESEHFQNAARAADAVRHAEQTGARVDTLAEAEALYAAQMVTEAEADDGTWRGAWIGNEPADDPGRRPE